MRREIKPIVHDQLDSRRKRDADVCRHASRSEDEIRIRAQTWIEGSHESTTLDEITHALLRTDDLSDASSTASSPTDSPHPPAWTSSSICLNATLDPPGSCIDVSSRREWKIDRAGAGALRTS